MCVYDVCSELNIFNVSYRSGSCPRVRKPCVFRSAPCTRYTCIKADKFPTCVCCNIIYIYIVVCVCVSVRARVYRLCFVTVGCVTVVDLLGSGRVDEPGRNARDPPRSGPRKQLTKNIPQMPLFMVGMSGGPRGRRLLPPHAHPPVSGDEGRNGGFTGNLCRCSSITYGERAAAAAVAVARRYVRGVPDM